MEAQAQMDKEKRRVIDQIKASPYMQDLELPPSAGSFIALLYQVKRLIDLCEAEISEEGDPGISDI